MESKKPENQHKNPSQEPQSHQQTGAPSGNKNETSQPGPKPLVNLPKGGGAIQGIGEKFEANPVTGTFSMSVPLAISPGRGGFTPQLSLSYDSGSGNSPFGLGWNVGIPNITRKTDKGLPQYFDTPGTPATEADTFILSGAEDLVPKDGSPIVNGDYTIRLFIPRTEGLFARIEQWRHTSGKIHWRTLSKENITSVYGESPSACIAHPDNANKIFSWYLERTFDAKGNLMVYSYKKEDNTNIPATANEIHRLASGKVFNKIYPDQVKYGNTTMYSDGASLSSINWLFTLAFDYGNYTTYTASGYNVTPTANWTMRQDAFSTHKAGFEVRTWRLCQRVLMFHRFTELDTAPVLVKSTELAYQQNPYLTLLQSVTHKSHDGAATAQMPPNTFTYSQATVGTKLHQVDPAQLENLPAGVDGSTWQFADLYGEGLSGVLRMENNAWYYKHNLGDKAIYSDDPTTAGPDLQLGAMQVLSEKPSVIKNKNASFYLGDVDSDSQPEIVFHGPGMHGYYSFEDGKWANYRPFGQMPNIDLNGPNVKMMDLTGDGLADILISCSTYFEMYFSAGKEGYTGYRRVNTADTEDHGPVVLFSDATRTIFLADMDGDGLTDIVRITNNSVCYWPNQGYGRFGEKVMMKNTPMFDAPDLFNPSRVQLADVDGTGTTDILYLGRSGVTYYKNQAGNGWGNAEAIAAFPAIDNLSQVHVADLLGNGTSCLVWSSPLPAQAHNFRFVELTSGIKPYMLTQFENNMGRKVTLTYAPSTLFYLRDKAAGKPWITHLPFPVQVLKQVVDHEQVTNLRLVNRYAYHHGYYDTAEREFRGFGMVEQWDAELLNADTEGYQPPVYTKKWFHTGFYRNRENISQQFAGEYFSGDTQAWLLPDTLLPTGLTFGEEREACRALRGQLLRSEVYATDGTAAEGIPYLVEEKNYEIKVLQRRGTNRYGVFMTVAAEALSHHYERQVADPRIGHTLTLLTDSYGNVLQSAQVAYPRRVTTGALAEQLALKVVLTQNDFINRAETAVNLIGIPYQARVFEVTGLTSGGAKIETASLKTAMDGATEIDFAQTPGSGVNKRCFQHQQNLFYNQALTAALPLGEVAAHALPYRSLTAELTDALLTALQTNRADLTATLLTNEAKYIHESGKYWIPTEVQQFDPLKFYLPVQITDPFNNSTSIDYDSYNLFITKVTDALNFETLAAYNYHVLQPWQLTDPNGNHQQVGFDTLGMVTALALVGKNGEGDTLAAPTIAYSYDLTQWQQYQKPLFAYMQGRVTHQDANTLWMHSYVYTGGLGNQVMVKVQAEDRVVDNQTLTNQWVGTGRTILNNKGKAIKQYEPYFSSTSDYEDEATITQNGVTPIFYYDPVGRNIKTEFPDGTLARVEFTPWIQKNFDQNDTVLESQWYIDNGSPDPEGSEPTNPQQRAAWLAAKHANTPQVQHSDSMGRPFRTDDDNGAAGIYTVHNTLDIAGKPTVVTDAKGRAMTTLTHGMAQSWVTQNIDSGTRWLLPDVAGKPLYTWDSRGHKTQHTYDALQRPLSVSLSDLSVLVVERIVYGTSAALNNIGQIAQHYDQSGQTLINSYDFKGNPLQTTKTFAENYQTYIDWSDSSFQSPLTNPPVPLSGLLSPVSFLQSVTYDALNRPLTKTLPDGTVQAFTYNQAGLLETVTNNSTAFVTNINYNEKGQRTDIYYGNGSKTRYYYDAKTFRLTRLLTTRNTGQDVLQDLNYTYDPVGNITQQVDNAQQIHYFSNSVIEPKGMYKYDALYRLIEAKGRELTSLQLPTHTDFANNIPVPNTASNAMQNYTQQYSYDELGNMQQMNSVSKWTRDYVYATDTNRLLKHDVNQTLPDYTYDAHGNMLTMPHLQGLQWDYKDQLQNVELDASGNKAYYIYDAGGQRVRKVIEKGNIKEERYYLGDYELYRKTTNGTLDFERKTIHISDDKKKIALLETKTGETEVVRYQYDNHLGSASLELDASANTISYEEYHPFGTTSYRSGHTETETSLKRYKYVGKERDEETGLYYYGARYYAAWLCRFVSVDPLQHKYPYYTPYQYAGNKPITFIDLDGLEEFKVNYEETARKDVTNIAPPIKQNLLPINLDKLPVLNSKEFPKYSISQPNNDAKNPVGSVSKEANITNQDLKIQEKGEKLLENIYYTKGYAYIPFTAKSGTVYEKGDLISVKDRISKYGGENKPTWCNMFARDLMTEIYGEAPYEGDKTAKEFHDYVKEHPEKFVPLTGTFEDTWKNHINKNEFVIFIDDGHVAVGLPTDLLTTKTYPESETSSKTDSVGNVIQSGKDQGMMILSKAWSKNDFKNIKMYKYVPQKK